MKIRNYLIVYQECTKLYALTKKNIMSQHSEYAKLNLVYAESVRFETPNTSNPHIGAYIQ